MSGEYLDAVAEILAVFDADPRMTEELLAADPEQLTAEAAALVKIREIIRAVLEGSRRVRARTDMTEVTHNVWVKPSAVDIVRFAVDLGSKDPMKLEVCCGPVTVTVMTFDGSNNRAWASALDRMNELVQRVDAANRRTDG